MRHLLIDRLSILHTHVDTCLSILFNSLISLVMHEQASHTWPLRHEAWIGQTPQKRPNTLSITLLQAKSYHMDAINRIELTFQPRNPVVWKKAPENWESGVVDIENCTALHCTALHALHELHFL